MFEKFTQKSIDVIQQALTCASTFHHNRVLSSHILLGLVTLTKGVQARIMYFDKINFAKITELTKNSAELNLNQKSDDNIMFSLEARNILKSAVDLSDELNSKFVLPMHLGLAILLNKDCSAYKIIKQFDVDEDKIIQHLKRMLDKSDDIKIQHPEIQIETPGFINVNDFLKEKTLSSILDNAQSKVTTKGYEIVGTEQIIQAILDNKNFKITEILEGFSINSEIFAQEVSQIPSRKAEFENSEKQIIFTPNAFCALMSALDFAHETGNVEIMPEHIIMGVLKSQKGIAYHILSNLLPKGIDFEDVVLKKMNDNIPETLAILRLAKSETIALESSTIGTEMILLGILSYGTGIAANTLRKLGITLKDTRSEVLRLIKPEKDIESLVYSPRAKKILEIAYETAQEHKRTKIKSENILYGITKTPDCLAMKVLSYLGTDVLEIQQGIKQELLGGMEL